MKTLVALLLVAGGIGAAYWKTQRPGEGVEALRADALAVVDRLRDGVAAVRQSGTGSDNSASPDAKADDLAAAQSDITATREALDSTNQALTARINELEQRLSSTVGTGDSSGVAERVGAIESSLQNNNAELASLATAPDELNSALQRVETLEGKLDLLSRRLEEADPSGRIDEIAERVDGMSTSIAALNTRASRAADQAAESTATVEERLSTLDSRVSTIAAGGSAGADGEASSGQGLDAATDQRIAAIESKLDTARASSIRVQALSNRFGAMDNRLEQATEADTALQASLERLEASVAQMVTQADALSIDTVQQEIREQLANLDEEVANDSAADVSTLTDSLDATRERIKALESRVQELPASSSEADDAQQTQSALEAQIAALERRLETLPAGGSDAALADSLTEVRERVNELSTQDFVTQEELRAQVEGKNVEYKIYFNKNSTSITDEAAVVLDSFIVQETNRTTGVDIYGFTDRAGAASYNQQLAQRRASAVRSYLLQNGFDFTKIDNVAGLGEDAAAALLEDDQEDAQQRVVVLFASQL